MTQPSVMQHAARNKGFLLNEVINLSLSWVGKKASSLRLLLKCTWIRNT